MTKLYEISNDMIELAKLADIDEDMQVAVADTMEGLQASFEDKAKAVASVLLNMNADTQSIDDAIKRLQHRKALYESRYDSLISYLRANMEAVEIKKIDCPLFSITRVQGRKSVIVDDLEQIPDAFVVIPEPKKRADKKKIMDAHKDGATIPGAHIERGQSSIRIK